MALAAEAKYTSAIEMKFNENNTVIVNVATRHFVRGQLRLQATLQQVGYKGSLLLWRNKFPPDSPWHKGHQWPHGPGMIPYAFKRHAIAAARVQGYRYVIWCDASIVALKPLEPLLEYIDEHGYWLANNGWSVGQWCTDSALGPLRINRQQAFGIKLCTGGAFALDLSHGLGMTFLNNLLDVPQEAYCGPWRNDDGEASADKQVLGHRHDQTVMSVVAWRLGMPLIDFPQFFAYLDVAGPIPDDVILGAKGVREG